MPSIEERMASAEVKISELERKMNSLENLTNSISRIAYCTENMQGGIATINTKIDDLSERMSKVENRPGETSLCIWKRIGTAVIGGLITIAVTFIIATYKR